MATAALELAAVELVHCLPPFSHALGEVTLGLASGMTETCLSPLFSQNNVGTAVLRVSSHGHARG